MELPHRRDPLKNHFSRFKIPRSSTPISKKIRKDLTTNISFYFLMAFLKFLRFKLRRNRKRIIPDTSASVDPQREASGDENLPEKNTSVRIFSWKEMEMEKVTADFSSVIGYGGFSTVYRARLPGKSSFGAIKVYQSSSERLNRVYEQELEVLLRLQHNNIVKLLGYCKDKEEGILVFEYVTNGNLQEKLHGRSKGPLLSWKRRMAIAFQLAEAMAYLHDTCTPHIIHGDIKLSNILLDEHLNCKLCDFGSAKTGWLGASCPTTKTIVGSPGYTDPHYVRTGIASKKNDVYSFGVVVLELITGIEAFCAETGERLTAAKEIVPDPRLNLNFDGGEEFRVMASGAAMCLRDSPSLRPSASDLLKTMREKIRSTSFLFL